MPNTMGWVQLIMAGLSAFVQVWQTIHGMPPDATHMAVTAGLAASGAAHISNSKNGAK